MNYNSHSAVSFLRGMAVFSIIVSGLFLVIFGVSNSLDETPPAIIAWIALWLIPSAVTLWITALALSALLRIADAAESIEERLPAKLTELLMVDAQMRVNAMTPLPAPEAQVEAPPEAPTPPAPLPEVPAPAMSAEDQDRALADFQRYCTEVDAAVSDPQERQRLKLAAARVIE